MKPPRPATNHLSAEVARKAARKLRARTAGRRVFGSDWGW